MYGALGPRGGVTGGVGRPVTRPAGDPSPGDMLLRTFSEIRDELVSTLWFLVGNPEDAQDMAQEVFLRCWRTQDRLPQVRDLRAWIFRVGLNAAKDLKRSAWRRRVKPLLGEEIMQLADGSVPGQSIEDEECLKRVRQAMLDRCVYLAAIFPQLRWNEIEPQDLVDRFFGGGGEGHDLSGAEPSRVRRAEHRPGGKVELQRRAAVTAAGERRREDRTTVRRDSHVVGLLIDAHLRGAHAFLPEGLHLDFPKPGLAFRNVLRLRQAGTEDQSEQQGNLTHCNLR